MNRLLYSASQTARVGWFLGHYLMSARLAPPTPKSRATPPRGLPSWGTVLPDLVTLFRRDRANIEAGHYLPPHDMLPRPDRVADRARRYLGDLENVNRRRGKGIADEVARPDGTAYPDYYLQNFHYQSDGYLSAESARLYDFQVEVLFTGGADAMRRQALVPIARYFRSHKVRQSRLLDIACGTGRFLTFVKDNHPRLDVAGIDLSPPYLAEARRNLASWRGCHFLQADAERLPVADGSHDLVTCVYLFHEVPRAVRARVAAEIKRVLAPGGLAIFVDSIQLGDHPPYDALLDRFPLAFHEPFYEDYVRQDMTALFAANGLATLSVERAFFSRIMVLAHA